MKLLNGIKKITELNLFRKASGAVALSLVSMSAFAADEDTLGNLTSLQTVLNSNAGTAFRITVIIATLVGLILIVKGLIHLKQNYTGSGQEKHLSKGIASLAFGVALILAVPISHMLVGSIDSATTFNTNAGTVDFS